MYSTGGTCESRPSPNLLTFHQPGSYEFAGRFFIGSYTVAGSNTRKENDTLIQVNEPGKSERTPKAVTLLAPRLARGLFGITHTQGTGVLLGSIIICASRMKPRVYSIKPVLGSSFVVRTYIWPAALDLRIAS